jgi:N-acetyl-anhydromuramyl-L-alanine amidase AmpD
MKIEKISEHEKYFEDNLLNSDNILYSVKKTTVLNTSTIKQIRPAFDTYYYKEEIKKNKIILHYTVGTLRGDLSSLTKPDNYMSVAYLIGRNGIIYELFSPEYWSYHLGQSSVGGNGYNSKESIAIELSNYGPLKLVGENLETIYSEAEYTIAGVKKTTSKDIYCSIGDKEAYNMVSGGFRGYECFASFTNDQLTATKELIAYLCDRFNIPKKIMNQDKRCNVFSSDTEAKEFKGICSHVNFRPSGKWDIGPHFSWLEMVDEKITSTTTPAPITASTTSIPTIPIIPEVKTIKIQSQNNKKNFFVSILNIILKLVFKK